MNDLSVQLENTVKEYGENIEASFSDGLTSRIVDHIVKNYKLDELDQEELDEFLDSDAIEQAVDFFWNDYLNEE